MARHLEIAVFAVAIALRAWAAVDARDAPFWAIPSLDEKVFLELAHAIRAGIAPPHGAYFVAPGYAYFLAALEVAGGGLVAAKLLHLLLGAISAAMVTHLTLRVAPPAFAFGTGLLWAIYPTALLQDLLISKSGLATLALLGATAAWLPAAEASTSVRRWIAGGLCFGAGTLLRPEWMATGVIALAAAIVARRRRWPGAPPPGALLAAGACVTLAIAVPTLQNAARARDFVLIAYGSGPNFYIGNHAAAHGGYAPLRPDRSEPAFEETDAVLLAERDAGRALSPSAVSRFWWRRAGAWWREHPLAGLRVTAKKWALLWGPRELADGLSARLASEWIGLLRVERLIPALVLPAALAGLWVTRRRRDLWLLHALIAGMQVAIVPFFLFERFRLPMVALCLPFTAAACRVAGQGWRTRRRRTLAGIAVTSALAAALALPRIPQDEMSLRAHLGALFFEAHRYHDALREFETVRHARPQAWRIDINVANTHAALGDHAAALQAAEHALARLHEEAAQSGLASTEELAYCHELAGELARVRGAFHDARRHFGAALQFAAPKDRPRLQARLDALQSQP
jgi:hypothetical protein